MFASTVSLNRYTFWNTIEKFASRLSQVNSRTSWPPTRTLPALTSQKRAMRFAMVVLPEPDGPTMAHVVPSGMAKLTSCSTVRASGPSS